MILKSISIHNWGAVSYFTCKFEDGLNTIKHFYTDELFNAIQFVMNSKTALSLPKNWARKATSASASVFIDNVAYRVEIKPNERLSKLNLNAYSESGIDVTMEYLYLTSHCEAHDRSDTFDGNERGCHLRFLEYVNDALCDRSGALYSYTGGLSNIKAFRSFLSNHIKNFVPETIRDGKQYQIILRENGLYDVQCTKDASLAANLSESEEKLFRYLCFLKTAEFWQEFEEIRNLHGINKPILIKNFLEYLDEAIDVKDLIRRTSELNRQIILFTTPTEKRTLSITQS